MTQIFNPLGAGATELSGLEQSQPASVRSVKVGSVAVSTNDLVVWVAVNTDIPPVVIPNDAGTSDPAMIAGVALHDAPVGGTVLIARSGPVKVKIDDETVAAGQQCTVNATADGCALGVTADATSIVGDYCGVFLGAEIGSTNTAWVDLRIGG